MKDYVKLIAASIIGSVVTISVFMLTGMNHNEVKLAAEQHNLPVKRTVYTVDKNGESVPLNFTGVSKDVMESVVHVKVSRTVNVDNRRMYGNPLGDLWGDDFFRFFFDEPQGNQQRRYRQEPFVQEGAGSGVIISSNGYIVTNNHVVEGAGDIEVTLHDNQVYKGRVIGTDPSTDLAVIQIKADGLQPVPIGNSDNVEVGDWVLAVGNPFNLNSTVTAGIISAKGRNINIINDRSAIEAFLQTDAAINPGNSGGALVNLNGELVGINTAIASLTGTYAGYGFAIPSNIVSKVVNDIMKYGMVQRAFLGVLIRDINGELAKEKNLKVTEGAYVDSLPEVSAAREAGIMPGDVIVELEGKPVAKSADVLEAVGTHRPGDEISMVVNRKGKELSFNLVLANQKGKRKLVSREDNSDIMEALGASFETLDKDTAHGLGIEGGVEVKELSSGILKSQTDMREGFIITGINKAPVKSVGDLEKELKDIEGGVMIEGIYPDYPGVVFYAFGIR